MRSGPELYGKLLAKGGWDHELVADLPPQPGDIVVACRATAPLQQHQSRQPLRARGIRALVFTGIATNVCVESTLRDSFPGIFQRSCCTTPRTMPARTSSSRRRYNIEKFFGWVSSTDEFRAALQAKHQPHASDGEGENLMPMNPLPARLGKTLAPYSPGAMADGVVYVAGTLALDANANPVHVGDAGGTDRARAEHHQVGDRGRAAPWRTSPFNQIFITDWRTTPAVNGVYASSSLATSPARYRIQCAAWKKGVGGFATRDRFHRPCRQARLKGAGSCSCGPRAVRTRLKDRMFFDIRGR